MTTTTVLTIFNTNEENEGDYRCIESDDILISEATELSVGELNSVSCTPHNGIVTHVTCMQPQFEVLLASHDQIIITRHSQECHPITNNNA